MMQQSDSGSAAHLPIGVFDSGVGGLTVFSAIRKRLPHEHLLYLGDTARLPYGTKSTGTIAQYTLQATQKLVERHIKLLVVACNTATAAALPALQQAYPHLPVIGVVEPGAHAACEASASGNILVLATESTINNKAYTTAIQAIRPDAQVTGIPCSLFVALAEEGWLDGPIVESVAARYLDPVLAKGRQSANSSTPDCLVLGCTHFPLLLSAIGNVAGAGVRLVDSAATTAIAVEKKLRALNLLRLPEENTPAEKSQAHLQFLTTDAPQRFLRVGSLFLGEQIPDNDLELVALTCG